VARARVLVESMVVASMLAVGGCDADVLFSDSIDETIDFRDAGDEGPGLHDPYVVGATFELWAEGGLGTLVSSDADVLALDGGDDGRTLAQAVGPGRAEVSLVDDDGDVVATFDVEVRAPSRAVLHAAGPVLLDRADVPTEAMAPRIVEGGAAIFLVQYFDGATRLAGAVGPEPLASAGLGVTVLPELLGERRDWLRVEALGGASRSLDAGAQFVTLFPGSDAPIRIDIDVVDPEVVADVDVFASEVDRGVVVASAYDLDGDPVYGVAFDWSPTEGAEWIAPDVVRPGAAPMTLAARFGDLDGAVTTGDDPVAAGCAIAAPRGLGAMTWMVLALAACRRRRPSSQRVEGRDQSVDVRR
jgi:hypothetical protein